MQQMYISVTLLEQLNDQQRQWISTARKSNSEGAQLVKITPEWLKNEWPQIDSVVKVDDNIKKIKIDLANNPSGFFRKLYDNFALIHAPLVVGSFYA